MIILDVIIVALLAYSRYRYYSDIEEKYRFKYNAARLSHRIGSYTVIISSSELDSWERCSSETGFSKEDIVNMGIDKLYDELTSSVPLVE